MPGILGDEQGHIEPEELTGRTGLDIGRPKYVQVIVNHPSKTVHVNVNGVCLFRAGHIIEPIGLEETIVDDVDLDAELAKANRALEIAFLTKYLGILHTVNVKGGSDSPEFNRGVTAGRTSAMQTLQSILKLLEAQQ
jgi:hypothetical protein